MQVEDFLNIFVLNSIFTNMSHHINTLFWVVRPSVTQALFKKFVHCYKESLCLCEFDMLKAMLGPKNLQNINIKHWLTMIKVMVINLSSVFEICSTIC